MRRRSGVLALLAILVLLFGAAFYAAARPSDAMLRWISGSVLHIPAEWQSSSAHNGAIKLRVLRYPIRAAQFQADEAVIVGGLVGGVLSGLWELDFLNAKLTAKDPRWPAVNFASGRAAWRPSSGILQLRNWSSSLIRFDADLHIDGEGRIRTADIAGDADPLELAKVLSGWKLLKAADGVGQRRTFRLEYSHGQIAIHVDGKPFFKASWSGSVNF